MSKEMKKLNTVQDWLGWVEAKFEAANLFYGHGTDNAWDEAVQLVLYVLGLPAHSGTEVLNHTVMEKQGERIISLVKQRIDLHKPLPYLTHQAWFAGLSFYVDERVLIPRSPFGEWIERQFIPWINPNEITRILDIGTGSGCMAIAAAVFFPDASVDAVDINAQALEVAAINIKNYQFEDRVKLIEANCFPPEERPVYDIIMSNPPYVGSEEMATLPEEYLHEPRQALEADNQGLAIVENILKHAVHHLKPHGILVVEVGNSEELLIKKFPQIPFIWLELERGGQGLFLLTADELRKINVW